MCPRLSLVGSVGRAVRCYGTRKSRDHFIYSFSSFIRGFRHTWVAVGIVFIDLGGGRGDYVRGQPASRGDERCRPHQHNAPLVAPPENRLISSRE